MGVSIWEGSKAERVATALEVLAMNGSSKDVQEMNWQTVRNIVRGGLAQKAFDIGTRFTVAHENSMTATKTGQITGASVVEATFLENEDIVGTGIHVFLFHEGVWTYNGEPVQLAKYGITVTGTPAEGDEVIITEAFDNIDLDLVTFEDAVDAQNAAHKAIWLQSHWLLNAVQFDASEAIWTCVEALPVGTYNFTIGQNWGTHVIKDKVYQFTLEHEVPIGGQIVIGTASSFYTWGAPDTAPSNWRAYTFSEPKSVTPIDGPVELTEGSGGTNLGTLSNATKYAATGGALNNIQRCAYGYNRWSQSAMRQWLNSDKAVGTWWEPQNPFDRPPAQLATLRGFLAGLPHDFLQSIQPVKVVTALNTITDVDIGASETTIDRVFMPSLEQEYIAPQASGVEGSYWPYWKERLQLNSPQAQGSAGTNANHIRYAVENHASAQNCRLRSANRGSGGNAWSVNTSGNAYSNYATSASRPAPACVIY